jgi:hypothetical protein
MFRKKSVDARAELLWSLLRQYSKDFYSLCFDKIISFASQMSTLMPFTIPQVSITGVPRA